jgi:hypothetical protein
MGCNCGGRISSNSLQRNKKISPLLSTQDSAKRQSFCRNCDYRTKMKVNGGKSFLWKCTKLNKFIVNITSNPLIKCPINKF